MQVAQDIHGTDLLEDDAEYVRRVLNRPDSPRLSAATAAPPVVRAVETVPQRTLDPTTTVVALALTLLLRGRHDFFVLLFCVLVLERRIDPCRMTKDFCDWVVRVLQLCDYD